MTEAILDQQEVTKRNISQLLSQLTNTYQNTRSERKEIVTQFPPENEEFSLLEEIELLTVNLRGYASQIASENKITKNKQRCNKTKIRMPSFLNRAKISSPHLFSHFKVKKQ
jgi:hypothetical protein